MRPTPALLARIGLALVLLAVAALAACGSDGGADEEAEASSVTAVNEDSEASSTTAADESSTSSSVDDASPAPVDDPTGVDPADDDASTPTEEGATDGDLSAFLLTADDLPEGFVDQTDTAPGLAGAPDLCTDVFEATLPAITDRQARVFARGESGAFVASGAARFEADPAEVLQSFRDQVAACNAGDDATYSIEAAPGVGDETVRIVVASERYPAEAWIARVDDVILLLVLAFAPGPGPGLPDGQALLEAMADRS